MSSSSSSSSERDADSASSGPHSPSESNHCGAAIFALPAVSGAGTLSSSRHPLTQARSSLPPAKKEKTDENKTEAQAPDAPSSNGLECSIKTLYEGPRTCHCCTNWVEEYPEDIHELVGDAEDTKAKAIVARMKKNHGEEDDKPLVLDSIVIQSPVLKDFLAELFRDYESITPQLKKLVLKAPFHEFYHSWESFRQLMDQRSSQDKAYLMLLFDLLQPEIQPIKEEVADMVANNVISFDLLWTLFPPRQLLYSEAHSQGYIYVLDGCGYMGAAFQIRAKYIDWDGTKLGYAVRNISISPFTGTKSIPKLDTYPLHLHTSPDAIRAHSVQRGAKFRDLCSAVQHKTYVGSALCEVNRHARERNVHVRRATRTSLPTAARQRDHQLTYMRSCFKLDERVMLDTALSPDRPTSLTSLKSGLDKPKMDLVDRTHMGAPQSHQRPHVAHHSPFDMSGSDSEMMVMPAPHMPGTSRHWSGPSADPRAAGAARRAPVVDLSLTDNELMLCSSVITAWCLTTKRWVWLLEIDKIQDISWNEEAFDQVVLPASHKDLVLSFVEAHISGDVKFDDIIKGKGLGLLMLLVGDPGLGKTLTAEALAEKVQRPLYMLTAGELGRTPESIEAALVKVLSMTAKWNAVLLLDECDVFLEERTSSRIEHNAIVAVFLR